MKSEEILEIIPSTEFPIGLGGCHADQTNFDCCVYDITIFDHTGEPESIIEKNNKFYSSIILYTIIQTWNKEL